ncbi:MAG TPA: hypothetical protein VF015_07870 [Acidimicrobiales bacterium]
MPDPADRPGDGRDPDDEHRRPADDAGERAADDDNDAERAERIYEEVGAENPDPITRREAIEGELEDAGLSEAGGALGEHNE